MTTFSIKLKDIERDWYIIDADQEILGRLASKIAIYLRGKHKPEYTSHMDVGDYIVVTNAEKVQVTGNKKEGKKYYHYSGYPGGMKSINFEKLINKKPMDVIKLAVKGMLPKGPLGRQMLKKLKVYAGNDHPHVAQHPKKLELF